MIMPLEENAEEAVVVREISPVPEEDRRRIALQRLVEFQQALDTYLRNVIPPDSLKYVVNKRDGTKKPVLERQQYAQVFRALGLTEPDPPQFTVRELRGGDIVYECTTRVVWPLMGVQAWGVGAAGTDEVDPSAPWGRRLHDARAKAHTRAWERAIANLIGLGALGEEEAADHPELQALPQAVQFVINLAAKKGITEEELAEYVKARWGCKLADLNAQRTVILKNVIETSDRQRFLADLAKWRKGEEG